MNYLLDCIVVLILVASVSINAKRGFVKCFLLLVSFAAAIVISSALSAATAPYIYDNFASKTVTEKIEEKLPDIDVLGYIDEEIIREQTGTEIDREKLEKAVLKDGDMIENIMDLVEDETGMKADREKIENSLGMDNILYENENIPQNAKDIIESAMENSKDSLYSVIRIFVSDNKASQASEISEIVVRPIGIKIIGLIEGIILFFLVSALLRWIVNRFDVVDKIPVAGKLNTILGGIAGAAEGLVIVFVAVYILKILGALTSRYSFADPEVINNTLILKRFYDVKF